MVIMVGAADKASAQEATTPAAASASAAVEVVAEVDLDAKPPAMKRRRKTEDQRKQRYIDKLKQEGKYEQRKEKNKKAASKSNVTKKETFEALTDKQKEVLRAKWREANNQKYAMKKAKELQAKAKQEAPTYLPLPCNLKYNEMAVFMPPANKEDESVLSVLENLNNYFKNNQGDLKEKYKQLSRCDPEGETGGVREINGYRYELFLNVPHKSTGEIDRVIRSAMQPESPSPGAMDEGSPRKQVDVAAIRNNIVQYANQQARREQRIKGRNYSFQNHALIISFGKVDEQDVHIDLHDTSHYQFGLICSNAALATSEFRPKDPVLKSGESLSKIWSNMPHGLSDKIDSNAQLRQLLNRYGSLLSDSTKVNTNKPAIKYPTGTLLSLPGGVAHAGPKSNGFRAVLFFTGTPDGCPPYDPDVQHCKTTLVSDFLAALLTGSIYQSLQ